MGNISRIYNQKVKQHRHYDKALHWTKLISITGGAQIIIQAVGFVSGIAIIRFLPVHEYAFYTLANTILGVMAILADGGIGIGVISQGGQVWQDKEKLGKVLATGLDLRRKFAILSLLVSLPILTYLLLQNNASWLVISLIVASIIPAFYSALSSNLLEVVPKLHQEIVPLQKNQIIVGIGRAVLTGFFVFVFPFTFVALLANGLPRIYGNIKLSKVVDKLVDTTQMPDPEIRRNILSIVKRSLPESIYYCLSGQISIWLISYFGNTNSIAQIGALSRLTTLLTFFQVVFGILVIPRYSKLPTNRKILSKNFIFINLILISIMVLFVMCINVFTEQILWILGENYSGLHTELLLSVIGGVIYFLSGIGHFLNSSRGWVVNPVFAIVINVVCIVIGVFLFNIQSIIGILLFNIYVSVSSLLVNYGYSFFKLTRI